MRLNSVKMVLFSIAFVILTIANTFGDTSEKHIIIAIPKIMPLSSEELKNQGLYPQLIRAIFQRVGYKAEIEFYPYEKIIEALKQGIIAGGAIVSYRDDRTAFLYYPDELYTIKIKVLGLKKGVPLTEFNGLESLKGSVVGTFKGSFIENELANVGVQYESTLTINQNLRKLILGRIDFIIAPEITALYLISQQFGSAGRESVIGYNPPYMIDKHYVAISKRYPNALEIVDAFNRGLKIIKIDGTYDRIKNQY